MNLAVGGFGRAVINSLGYIGVGITPIEKFTNNGLIAITGASVTSFYVGNNNAGFIDYSSGDTRIGSQSSAGNSTIQFYTTSGGYTNINEAARITSSRNLLIGTTTDNGTKLQNNGNFCTGNEIYGFSTSSFVRISGGGSNVGGASVLMFGEASSSTPGRIAVSAVGTQPVEFYAGGALRFSIKSNGTLNSNNMPTSAVGLVSGDIYSNLGILTIVP